MQINRSLSLSLLNRRFNVTTDKMFLVLRDSRANMVAGIKNCTLEAILSFVGALQLALNESVLSQQSV